MNDLFDTLAPMVTTIANEYGRMHRAHGADASDFSQTLYAWVVENENQVREWLDPEFFEEKDGTRLLATSLRNEAKDYAVDVKAQALGYKRSDLYWYGKNEVRSLLPSVFNQDAWHEPPQSEGRSTKAASEGGNWIATLADVAQAFVRLDEYDQQILRRFHEDGWTNVLMAEVTGISEQLMSYHHDRAITRLVKLLGGEKFQQTRQTGADATRDPFKGRHAVSNAAARAYQSTSYADD
jgi:hypothetical protein